MFFFVLYIQTYIHLFIFYTQPLNIQVLALFFSSPSLSLFHSHLYLTFDHSHHNLNLERNLHT